MPGGFVNILKEVFGGGNIVKTVGDIVDDSIYSKAERAESDLKAVQQAQEYELRREELDQEEFDKVLANHLEYYKIDGQDRADARATEVKVLNAPNVSWINANIRPIIGFFTILIGFALFFLLVFKKSEISAISENILYTILGGTITQMGTIYNFYFGSSSGSMDKDKVIQDLTKK